MRPRIEMTVPITMRDGIQLCARIYHPESGKPRPALVSVTPYGVDRLHRRATRFASAGYTCVLIDSRGRGNSDGCFRPNVQEAADGFDAIEHVAARAWCDGRVGMWGHSYGGYAQWATARMAPAGLQSIVPASSTFYGVDFPYRKNVYYTYNLRWQALVTGRSTNVELFSDESTWNDLFLERLRRGVTYRDLPSLLGSDPGWFADWCEHPEPTGCWDSYNPSEAEFANIRIPVLTITGHYDDNQWGAVEFFRRHSQMSEVPVEHYLVIGPWDHAGTNRPSAVVGGLRLRHACIDIDAVHLEWFDWTLRNGPKPSYLEGGKIVWFTTGDDAWRASDALEQGVQQRVMYLSAATAANKPLALLASRPDVPSSASFVSDQTDMVLAERDIESKLMDAIVFSDGEAAVPPGFGLVYESDTLEKDLLVTGSAQLDLWLSVDALDVDIEATLYEVREATATRLAHDLLRTRYRDSRIKACLLTPNVACKCVLAEFNFVSRLLQRGSRLRLLVRAPSAVLWQANYGHGGTIVDETSEEFRPQRVTLFHGGDQASRLVVPIGSPAARQVTMPLEMAPS